MTPNLTTYLGLYISEDMKSSLEKIMLAEHRVSLSDMVRALIQEALERRNVGGSSRLK